jgi:diguanylate cyclase (GGDEF)-like protein/PAS domain S-box-containing protein
MSVQHGTGKMNLKPVSPVSGPALTRRKSSAPHHRSNNKSLKDSELQFRRLFEAAQDGILILDGRTGKITEANQFIIDMLGYGREEILGKRLWEIGAFVDISKSKKAYAELKKKGYVRYEDIPLESKEGKRLEVEFVSNIYRADGKNVIQCNIRDISQRKLLERKLAFMATHDGLTGLPNRTLLYDRFQVAKALADRESGKLALASMDVDMFKDVNDRYGHDTGDKLLKKIASRLTGALRKSDTIARMGGDEFIALLSGIKDQKDALFTGNKISGTLKKQFIVDGHRIPVSVSMGIAIYPDDGNEIDILVKKSDKLMYAAKASTHTSIKLAKQ